MYTHAVKIVASTVCFCAAQVVGYLREGTFVALAVIVSFNDNNKVGGGGTTHIIKYTDDENYDEHK